MGSRGLARALESEIAMRQNKLNISRKIVMGMILVGGLSLSFSVANGEMTPQTQSVAPFVESIEDLTSALQRHALAYSQASRTQQSVLLDELLKTARQRKTQMLALVEQEPQRVLAAALPKATLAALPAEVQPEIEQSITREGADHDKHGLLPRSPPDASPPSGRFWKEMGDPHSPTP